ncbi:MAG TPA: toll/interleukin-1 receptor domain-containing protein, partial [Phototrophicaceae bacterium]|nr:toll/interleukin-1 receptor domain-containing protein [Phototrophicaceae bacterium]
MRIFISYAHADQVQIAELVDLLRAGGYEPWFDSDLIPGQDWEKQIRHAISESDAFVYALTPESLESEYCKIELTLAFENKKPIIPLKLKPNVKLPNNLARIQWVDFSAGRTPAAVARLLRAIRAASEFSLSGTRDYENNFETETELLDSDSSDNTMVISEYTDL